MIDSSHGMKDMDMFNDNSEEPTPIGILPPFPHAGPSDLNLICEIIAEDTRSGVSLPGPPPPPGDLLCHNPLTQNHRTLRSSSATAKPVLVARSAACESNYSAMRRTPCSARQMASPHSSRGPSSSAGSSPGGRGSSCPMSSKPPGRVPSENLNDTDVLDRVLELPQLVVVEEPKDRGMRFRYECEGRSAGSILGASSTETNKTQPAIEIRGSIDHIKKVTVTVSLVTKDLPHRPHPHCLVGKDCPNDSGICVVSFNPHSSRHHSFANLGIQCVKRRDLDQSLQKRRNQNIDPFQTGHTKGIEDIDMNAVRLCFQCELERDDGRSDTLSPVVSKPIFDKKATTTSQLKISLLNKYSGSCLGRTEIFMLCDKVQKDDIEILFRYGLWKANGVFSQMDVHRQIAIVFKTPPYQDQDISEPVDVSVVLRRISDQMESEPVTFTYMPQNIDPYAVRRKRATIKSDSSFKDKPCVRAESLPSAEQALLFLLETQNMMTDEEWLQSTPPAAPAVEEMNYLEAQEPEEVALFRQLLETPPEFFPCGFNQPADIDSFCNNNNTNTNMQDFSHLFDMQFNMMFNDTQNTQLEQQDDVVQVKTEEELQ